MSDHDLFVRACEALWGETWQTAASRALQISDRHIRRMAAGQAEVPPGVYVDLMRLTLEHQVELDKIVDELKRHGGGQ